MSLSSKVIKGKNPSLKWWADMLSFFQAETITVPSSYRERVLETKRLCENDVSGIVNTVLDFAIECALVNISIETDNDNLTDELNNWLKDVNKELIGKVPTGIYPLAKEYYRERWKGSSNLVLRTFWDRENTSKLKLPSTMFFVDGEDVIVKRKDHKDGRVTLGDEEYYIRINSRREDDIHIPRSKSERLFIQRPYESWGVVEPVPYLIRRGVFKNAKFLTLLSSKGEHVLGKALEYLMMIKKGTEKMALEGRAEHVYSEEDLKKVSKELSDLLQNRKNIAGTPTYTTNFDTEIEHMIPEYSKIINDELYSPIERKILSGLGMIEIISGKSTSRVDSILNPKPFISEVTSGIRDFSAILNDIITVIVQENVGRHKKWMNVNIKVKTSPVQAFINDKVKAMLRSIYDRGNLSRKTLVEIVGELDYVDEVKRKKSELDSGEDDLMFAPVIQNNGQLYDPRKPKSKQTVQQPTNTPSNKKEGVPDDKTGPEKRNYTQSNVVGEPIDPRRQDNTTLNGKEFEEAPYKKNTDLPDSVKVLPAGAQTIWREVFNKSYPKGEETAIKIAWTAVKRVYEKKGDKWIKKYKGTVENTLDKLLEDLENCTGVNENEE